MTLSRTLATLSLSAALLLTAGCYSSGSAGSSSATATFNKATGNIYTTVDRSLDDAFDAAQSAMNDMGYSTESANKDALKGIIKAREADKSVVTTTLDRKSDRVTNIEVNVGPLGSEPKARLILEKIMSRLGR